jgi:hypothetical protein
VRNASVEVGERLRRAGITTTDVFVEDFFGSEAELEVLLEILTQLAPGVTELMCHPGRVDEALRRDSSYVDERERELAILTHPEAIRAIQQGNITLTHFGEL